MPSHLKVFHNVQLGPKLPTVHLLTVDYHNDRLEYGTSHAMSSAEEAKLQNYLRCEFGPLTHRSGGDTSGQVCFSAP